MTKPNLKLTWHLGYPWLGGIIVGLFAWRFDAAGRVFRTETIEAAVLCALIALSALIISVLLALLGLLIALDRREVVQEIRRRNLYSDLIKMAFQPLVVFMVLALLAVFGLLTSRGDAAVVRHLVSTGALAATSAGLLATLRFAIQLTGIMLDEDSSDADDGKSTVEAARRRATQGQTSRGVPPESARVESIEPTNPGPAAPVVG
jgi:MFS family permease